MRNKIQIILHIIIVMLSVILFITPFVVESIPIPTEAYAFVTVLLLIYLLFTPISIFKINKKWK